MAEAAEAPLGDVPMLHTGELVGAQPDWALGLTLIRQVLIRQVENIGPPDLDLHSYGHKDTMGNTLCYKVLQISKPRAVITPFS